MPANRTAKKVAIAIAAALGFCWIAYLGRLYRTDPAFFLSRLYYDWREPRWAAFHRLYSRIHSGMTRQELQQAIEQVYPVDSSRKRPIFQVDEPTQIMLFMADEGCEGIMLRMANGRVVSKGYSPD
jgi:hypothetical protein